MKPAPRTDLSGMTPEERDEYSRVYQREYARTEKQKATRRKYNQSERGKAKNNAQCVRWRAANLARMRQAYRRDDLRKYGLTPETWEDMFAAQNRLCRVCKTDTPTKIGWVVDHCHKADYVRGILCSRCNTALGMVKDSPTTLRALADYLERSPP